jgi:hypothetical protein
MEPFYVQSGVVLQNGGSDRLVYKPQEATTWLRRDTAAARTLVGAHSVSTFTQLASISVLNALTRLQTVWAVRHYQGDRHSQNVIHLNGTGTKAI